MAGSSKATEALQADLPPAEDAAQEAVPPEQAEVRYTDEEVEEIERIATMLMSDEKKSDKIVVGACITMLAARQLYMSSLVDLNNRLAEISVQYQDGVRQVLVEAMQAQGQKPFNRTNLMDKLQKHVLPWLMAIVQSDDAKAAREEAAKEQRLDEVRRETTMPLGFPYTNEEPVDQLERSRTLTLAGNPGAVKYLLRLAVETALKQPEVDIPKLRVIHLSCYDAPYRNASKRANKDKLHLVLAKSQWRHKAASEKKFGDFMHGWTRMMRRLGIDLLVIDDLMQVVPPGMPGGRGMRFSKAVQCHRYIRKWADRAGCAVLVGLPNAIGGIDEAGNLGVYTTYCQVTVREGPFDEDYERGTYDVLVDNRQAVTMVNKLIIDNYE